LEHKKKYKHISVVCNHTALAHGVVDTLIPFSEGRILLLGNKSIEKSSSQVACDSSYNENLVIEEALLNDVVLTSSQLEGSELVVYIDHMDWHIKDETQMMSRLSALANVVNCCIELQNVNFVFIAPFTPMFGRHFNVVINENTIWESSMDLDLQSKYINLAEQEVFRGINEGLKATILSCGFNANATSSDQESTNLYIKSLLKLQRPSYQFIDHKDIYALLEKVINSDESPEKLLLVETSKSRSDLETMIDFKPSMVDTISSWLMSRKNTSTELVINNSKTKSWYQYPFTNIQAFFNQNQK
jgi:hypothetical protein